ncbi:hypothetical protein H6G91_14555 [Nostoc muscorum FACHB-395]|nr:hypothetical protein [Desmonostoc muscorum FACHB-395]
MIVYVGMVAFEFVEPDFTRLLECAIVITTLQILQVVDKAMKFNRLIFLLGIVRYREQKRLDAR